MPKSAINVMGLKFQEPVVDFVVALKFDALLAYRFLGRNEFETLQISN